MPAEIPAQPNAAPRIHLIDDAADMHELLADYFSDSPFVFSGSLDSTAGLEHVLTQGADLVLLDLMMPGLDGFEICRRLRAHDRWLPIVFLTARKDDFDRILGLEIGADDFLFKPFSARELEARIKSILRRRRPQSPPVRTLKVLSHGGLRLEPDSRQVWMHQRPIELTTTEFEILHCLMQNAGRVLKRDILLDTVYGNVYEGFDRTIDVMIYRLRHKLGIKGGGPIRTIRGVGYLFEKTDAGEIFNLD